MRYLTNAFSLNMFPSTDREGEFLLKSAGIHTIPLTEAEVAEMLEGQTFVSVVGHAATASLFSALLGTPVSENRQTVVLENGDELIVGQYTGPRLPEGATRLPPEARIRWFRIFVSVEYFADSDIDAVDRDTLPQRRPDEHD